MADRPYDVSTYGERIAEVYDDLPRVPANTERAVEFLAANAGRYNTTFSDTTASPIYNGYGAGLRPFFSPASSGLVRVATIPAARNFATRLMSFTGTGLVSGKWTVPFRSS